MKNVSFNNPASPDYIRGIEVGGGGGGGGIFVP
jgi:hypothetical protein